MACPWHKGVDLWENVRLRVTCPQVYIYEQLLRSGMTLGIFLNVSERQLRRKHDRNNNCFQDNESLYISACNRISFHLILGPVMMTDWCRVIWPVCGFVILPQPCSKSFGLENTASYTWARPENAKLYKKKCTRIQWTNRLKGLGGFFLLILPLNSPDGPSWSRTSFGTSLDRFIPSFFSAIPGCCPHLHSQKWLPMMSFQPKKRGLI